jgi:hypothetical protein
VSTPRPNGPSRVTSPSFTRDFTWREVRDIITKEKDGRTEVKDATEEKGRKKASREVKCNKDRIE